MMHSIVSRKRSGFTLIELMIVIAIIAILAAILVPNFVRARAQGHLTACKSNLKNIGTALEMYSTDHAGRYPLTNTGLQQALTTGNNGGYLKNWPKKQRIHSGYLPAETRSIRIMTMNT